MDKATIEAMRAVVDAKTVLENLRRLAGQLDDECASFDYACDAVALIERLMPKQMSIKEACDALNKFRHHGRDDWNVSGSGVYVVCGYCEWQLTEFEAAAIVEKYTRDQAEAEQPQAPAESDDHDVIRAFVDSLERVAKAAHGEPYESICLKGGSRSENWTPTSVFDFTRAINGLLDAKPTTTGDPTIEECVAAINRANHRGYGDWHVELLNGNRIVRLNADEFIGLGRLLIDRKRAEAAKGGAA